MSIAPPPVPPRRARAERARELVERLTATRRRRRLLVTAAVLAAVAICIPFLVNAAFQLLADVAGSPKPRVLAADSVVLDRTGRQIADLHPAGSSRLPVPLGAIAPSMQKAIVAIEDRHFWTEGAVDIGRLAGAAFGDAGGGNTQGASTIPMQLVKIEYLNDTRTISYKLEEIGLAQRLVQNTPKPVILNDYLNDAYFGSGATGVQAAAHVFFGVDARHLTLAQAALLAGLPNAPTANNPLTHPDAAKARQLQVLQALVSSGQVSGAEAVQAVQEPLQYAVSDIDDNNLAPAFVSRVAGQVASWLRRDPTTAGLHITTTLDLAKQEFAQQSVAAQVAQLGSLHVTDGAAVEIDPTTGDVLAYVGSAGTNVPGGLNDLAAAPRQPGSSFKLFTYSTALATGKASMVSQVLDGPITLPTGGGVNGMQPYSPLDYDRSWHGPQPLERALGNSLNVPAIRTELVTGIPPIVATAQKMGVTTLTQAPQTYGPSLTLGTYGVPLWQMAQAGSVFAASGTLHPTRIVLSIGGPSGTAERVPRLQAQPVLDPRVAFVMNTMLSNDANRAMEFGSGGLLTLPQHTIAAKTGTSEDFRDNVTIGWTPHLVTATWVGNADDSAMRGTTGITGAAPIWHDIMAHELTGEDSWPSPPEGLLSANTQWGLAYFLPGTSAQTGEPALMTIGAPPSASGGGRGEGGDNRNQGGGHGGGHGG
jgi:membrane peptidoglycan carboxypeptidase